MTGRHARQSFLGHDSEQVLDELIAGIVGLGDGGSHIAQQLAHIGVGTLVMADPDHVEDTNLNRLVGATDADVANVTPKTVVAERLVRAINPRIRIELISEAWQKGGLGPPALPLHLRMRR